MGILLGCIACAHFTISYLINVSYFEYIFRWVMATTTQQQGKVLYDFTYLYIMSNFYFQVFSLSFLHSIRIEKLNQIAIAVFCKQ